MKSTPFLVQRIEPSLALVVQRKERHFFLADKRTGSALTRNTSIHSSGPYPSILQKVHQAELKQAHKGTHDMTWFGSTHKPTPLSEDTPHYDQTISVHHATTVAHSGDHRHTISQLAPQHLQPARR